MAAEWIAGGSRVKAGTLRQHDQREPGPRVLEFMGGTFTNTGTVFLQSVGIQFPDPELDGGGHLTLYAATFENVDNFISGSGQHSDPA